MARAIHFGLVNFLSWLIVGWAQVDSAYIRRKELGISPGPPPLPPGTPQPLTNPASDCPGAIRICQAVYNFSASVPNYGTTQELPGGAGTCLLAGEHRSVWFLFTIQQGGTLGFIIDPHSNTDYDFALWDVTGLTNPCGVVGSQTPIRCNYAASTATTSCCGGYTGGPGITGLDHTSPQPGNLSQGAGGAPVMAGLNVNAGQTFLLVVDNFANNNQGYTITFTGTAQYFDNTAPRMDSTAQLCASSYDSQIDNLRQIFVRFSELINVSTVAANGSDFVVEDMAGGGLVPVTAAAPINPPQTNAVRLTLGTPLTPGNSYKIRIGYNPPGSGSSNGQPGSDGNTISDQCGIAVPVTNVPQGSSADSIVLVVQDTLKPVISLTAPNCVGAATGRIEVSVTGGSAPYQYAVVSGISNTPPSLGWSTNGSFPNRTAGTYTVWIRDNVGCIVRRLVQLNDPPALSLLVLDSTNIGCDITTGSVTFTGQGGTPPYEYSILPGFPTWQTANTFTGLAAGSHTLRVRDANGCVATRSFTIQVLPPFTVRATDTVPILCAGGLGGFSVEATGGTPPYTYILVNSGTTNNTGNFTGLAAGNYTVRVYDAQRTHCGYIQITLPQPESLRVIPTLIKPITCRGGNDGEIRVAVRGGTRPYTFQWQTASGTPLPQGDSICPNLPEGSYTLKVIDANGCQSENMLFPLSYTYYVSLDRLSYTIEKDCPDKVYLFTAYVRGSNPLLYRWTWEDGKTELGSATMRRVLPPLLRGSFTVRLQVESPGPCYAETTFTFTSEACSSVLIPTAFTPNGDGSNDVWEIYTIGVSQYRLIVYDRWGREVFNNGGDMTKFWNGSINGQEAPEGVYTFTLEGTDINGEKVFRTGTVTLLR